MKVIEQKELDLIKKPKIWLITGVAGFIDSNLLEYLLKLNQKVLDLDNFSKGCKRNLDQVKTSVNESEWAHFKFCEGDVRHSQADFQKAKNILGYDPKFNINDGISNAIKWYIDFFRIKL
tara:strand:- start:12756 stop:13115 length:360 start_codon:yes stop_codon:yes gene_type:complete